MSKEKFKELAHLYLMEELDSKQRIEFENVMMENDDLQKEFENIRHLYETITENRPAEVDERLLISARNSLIRTLRNEAAKPSPKDTIMAWLKNIFVSNYKIAFSSVAMVMIGVFIGYLFFYQSYERPMIDTTQSVNIDNVTDGGTKISNIRFPNPFAESGEIEISFDAIKPMSYKGTAEDPVIQRLLATALVTENNPGLRLRTVNTIALQTESDKFLPDPKIKKALITALKVDNNPAVRREALNVLMKYPFDNEIRDVFLFVLSNDKNPGLRVASINALTDLKLQGYSFDDKIKTVLNNKAETDDNNFVRIRAASMLKEIK